MMKIGESGNTYEVCDKCGNDYCEGIKNYEKCGEDTSCTESLCSMCKDNY